MTGGQKGAKSALFDRIPPSVLVQLAEHYGTGEGKYPGDEHGPNYAKGYDWALSYAAAMRHLTAFWAGEDLDPETGHKHVIAAAWHCIAMAYFMDHHRAGDTRWDREL